MLAGACQILLYLRYNSVGKGLRGFPSGNVVTGGGIIVRYMIVNPFPATEIERALGPCADRPSIARASSVGCPRDLRALKPLCRVRRASSALRMHVCAHGVACRSSEDVKRVSEIGCTWEIYCWVSPRYRLALWDYARETSIYTASRETSNRLRGWVLNGVSYAAYAGLRLGSRLWVLGI